jgi:hypothetical protein
MPEVEWEEVGAEAEVPVLQLHHIRPRHGEPAQGPHHTAATHHFLPSQHLKVVGSEK